VQEQIEKPDMNNCSLKEWEKWFWQDFNDTCKECVNKCKQSWVVRLSCEKYKKKEI